MYQEDEFEKSQQLAFLVHTPSESTLSTPTYDHVPYKMVLKQGHAIVNVSAALSIRKPKNG